MDAGGRIFTITFALAALMAGTLAPRAAAKDDDATGTVPLTEFFHGEVVSAKKDGTIEIRYDFEDAAQLRDFDTNMPYRAIMDAEPSLERGGVRLKGTGSLRHKAVFSTQIGVEAQLTPFKPRDFGFAVTEERESEVFTLYCVQDTYFSLGDGVRHPQNMIIKFIPRDPKVNRDGFQDWRYAGSRGQKPEIQRNVALGLKVERGDNTSEMWMDDFHSKGREAGRDLSSQMAAVYVHASDVLIDDLVVRGTLSPGFVEHHDLDLSVEIERADPEAAEEPVEVEVDPAVAEQVRERIAAYPLGTKPHDMAQMIRDAALPGSLRREAVEKVLGLGNLRIVPFLVDGLYAEDEESRTLTFEAVEGLVGKSFGYRPGADEERRRRAISSLNEYIAKNRRKFQ